MIDIGLWLVPILIIVRSVNPIVCSDEGGAGMVSQREH
jgi:hypothetical protein